MITTKISHYSNKWIARDSLNVMNQKSGISKANAIARVKYRIANAKTGFIGGFTVMKPEKIK